jgi:hypothetical protein
MDDTSLLEAAARAMGRSIKGWNTQHGMAVAVLDDDTLWQPLLENHITDCMGDALRLAVKLALEIRPGIGMVAVAGAGAWEEVDTASYTREEATRRAIVRAAAALGETP